MTGLPFVLIAPYQLAQPDNFVIATARRPEHSTGLQELGAKYSKDRLAILSLDVSSSKSVEEAADGASALLPNGLDHLVLNAGIHPQPICTFDNMCVPFQRLIISALVEIFHSDFKLLQEELRFNTEFPIVTIRTFLPLVRKSTIKKVVFVSSVLGSIESSGKMPGLTNAYSISKAALNMYDTRSDSAAITNFKFHR
jgi:NAD(P)-dependent dehydrogenase (short-subunit alcohol dehydrogenase family)